MRKKKKLHREKYELRLETLSPPTMTDLPVPEGFDLTQAVLQLQVDLEAMKAAPAPVDPSAPVAVDLTPLEARIKNLELRVFEPSEIQAA